MKPIKQTIQGFSFSGINCGIKENRNKKDLAAIFSSPTNTQIAGVFTQNKVCAAPVKFCQKQIKKGKGRLIIINSGNANAATGKQGEKDVLLTAKEAAKQFGVELKDVFICSTGKIGARLPIKKLMKGLSKLKKELRADNFKESAQAIMTTDAYMKTVFAQGEIAGRPFNIGIMAKGAGMICPDMATLLCFIMTDLVIERRALNALLKESVDETLNALTVDGDTSTNDTALIMASGLAKNKVVRKNSKDYSQIKKILTDMLQQIAVMIATDGEGATRALDILVCGAKNKKDAHLAARAIGNSQLVKTAVFGNDPNWGRILSAAGASGASLNENKTTIKIGTSLVFLNGRPLNQNEKKAALYMKTNQVLQITIDLGKGRARAKILASDLTYDYIKINADYRT